MMPDICHSASSYQRKRERARAAGGRKGGREGGQEGRKKGKKGKVLEYRQIRGTWKVMSGIDASYGMPPHQWRTFSRNIYMCCTWQKGTDRFAKQTASESHLPVSLSLQSSLLKKNIFRVILIKKRSSVGCEYPFIWKECLEGSKMGLVELIQIRIPNQITGELCIILQYCKFHKGKEGRPESKQLRKRNMQATSHQN